MKPMWKQLAEANATIARQQERVAALETENVTVRAREAWMGSEIATLKARVAELEAQRDATADTLERFIEAKDRELDALQAALDAARPVVEWTAASIGSPALGTPCPEEQARRALALMDAAKAPATGEEE